MTMMRPQRPVPGGEELTGLGFWLVKQAKVLAEATAKEEKKKEPNARSLLRYVQVQHNDSLFL